jgi:hypothetical protein
MTSSCRTERTEITPNTLFRAFLRFSGLSPCKSKSQFEPFFLFLGFLGLVL